MGYEMDLQALGKLIARARIAAGIAQQSELAAKLGVTQQTISRWEQGLSRPRTKQMAALAAAVQCEVTELLAAAGYTTQASVTVTYDQPWPLDALSEESFERFCTDFLQMSHREAKVNRYGGRGHTQEGLDIDIQFPDGIVYTYQCKRHSEFGPKKIEKAAAAHTRSADKRHLLLSCLASPQAREAIKKHPDWELWDREDISRRIRQDLDKAEQRILVDTYFPGQRQALIGELEPSPWQKPDKFFAGMMETGQGFSHAWQLVGREGELSELIKAITVKKATVVQLQGAGGSGKTRLIKAVADNILASNPGASVYVLSRDRLDSKSLDDLGTKPKVLICDDAHEREDLGLLFDYIADPNNNAQLLIAYRQYGEAHVKQQAAMLITEDTPTVKLTKLSPADAEALATQALSNSGADTQHAKQLARYTRDCPLATIIGAQILSEKGAIPEFLHGEEKFRDILMNRLVDKIVNGVSSGLNEGSVRQVLSVIALIQPIHEDDAALAAALEPIASLNQGEVARIVKRLREAGVLFQRGRRSRIAPDLLGDFLIEDACVSDSNSTGFTERVLEIVPSGYTENILVNLGRLDWRMSNGDTRQSRLLDALWGKLDHSEPHINAVAAVAYYQPDKALRYAQRRINDGDTSEKIVNILKNIAYNYEYLADVCQLLWKLGRNDARPLNQHPSHSIRVLNELGCPEPSKPAPYVELVVDFALSLINIDSSWDSTYTPLDILEGALSTEGHTTTATSRVFTMSAFYIPQRVVAPIRRKITDALIGLLNHPNPAIGYKAASKLSNTLRGPSGLFGAKLSEEYLESWTNDFCETLSAIDEFLDRNPLPSPVLMGVCKSVSWHAFYAKGPTRPLAKKIMNKLDHDLQTRTIRMLMDGWGHSTFREDGKRSWQNQQDKIKKFAIELSKTFTSANELLMFTRHCIEEIAAANADKSSMHILINHLIEESVDFSELVAHEGLIKKDPQVSGFSGSALASLLERRHAKAKEIISSAIETDADSSLLAIAETYSRYRPSSGYNDDDIAILKRIVSSSNPSIAFYSSQAIRRVSETDKATAIDLLMSCNMVASINSAHELFLLLSDNEVLPVEAMNEGQVEHFLSILFPLEKLDDYWVQDFLKDALQRFPEKVISLFKSRVEKAVANEDWSLRPVPHGPYRQSELNLIQNPQGNILITELLAWALKHNDDFTFIYRFGELIEALCAPFDSAVIDVFQKWLSSGGREHLEVIASALREAPNDLVFRHKDFAIWLLRRCQSFGDEVLKEVSSRLYACSVSGMRSGTPGKPFPEDIELRNNAKSALDELGRFEPAYALFADLLQHAEHEIARGEEEGRILDEEDEDA